jgi:hypothetical protein
LWLSEPELDVDFYLFQEYFIHIYPEVVELADHAKDLRTALTEVIQKEFSPDQT